MEQLRDSVVHALVWVAKCRSASAGDHLEALAMLRDLTRTDEERQSHESFEIRERRDYLASRYGVIDRDARTRAADMVRAARPVFAALCPPSRLES